MNERSAREALAACIDDLFIVDSHEHLPMEADRPQDTDVLAEWLIHYFSCDLVSAGLSDSGLERARDSRVSLRQRWQLVEPYWEAARSTGYGRSLDLAAQAIYGIERVDGARIEALNEAFVAARQQGGHYRHVLRDKGRIAVSVVDSHLDCDREFFASAIRMDPFIMPTHRCMIRDHGDAVGIRVHGLEDWEESLGRHIDAAVKRGAVVIKHGLAYMRSLHYPKVSRAAAEEEFNLFFAEEHAPAWRPPLKAGRALQDYMMHALLRHLDRRGMTLQVHTGIQEGNGNVIADANPVHLTNCFLEYDNITFDLFHMGYPYTAEIGNLAKNFRNVNIDMCWGHIISPEAARRALIEWLDAVPANKIIGFGGDYCFVDGVYGHQRLARDNVAAALAHKVVDGSFDLDHACQLARWILVDNPRRILNLEDRVAPSAT